MAKDKFSAVWVSHSSIADYLKCPRAYFLRNLYRDLKTNHKVTVMSAPLALGQAVHEVLEALSVLPIEERFTTDLKVRYDRAWSKLPEVFRDGYDRGWNMLQRVANNPGPLLNKAIKIRQDLPYFWLSEDDNIILCGKIDWLEYLPETDSVGILDFKTGKYDEDPESLQLPIYLLVASRCQTRPVTKASYWYVDRDDAPKIMHLPDPQDSHAKLLNIAKKIALARKLKHFVCPQNGGCRACFELEAVVAGKGKYIGTDNIKRDVYIL